MNCPECSFPMAEEGYAGVTVDVCTECGGLWLDLEEVHRYAVHEHPSAPVLPDDEFFSEHTNGVGDACPRCEESALEIGCVKGFDFRRCAWCGGIFIDRDSLHRILESSKKGADQLGVGEAALGTLELALLALEIF